MKKTGPNRHFTFILLGSALLASLFLTSSAQAAAGGGNMIEFMGRPEAEAAEHPCDPDDLVQSATFEGHTTSVGFLATVRWGDGVLTLNNGEQHKFSILGVKMLETGVAETHVVGEVYNLEKPEDFEGLYYGTGMDTALIKGEGEVVGKNTKNCVYVKAKSAAEGVKLSPPGPGGVEIKLID